MYKAKFAAALLVAGICLSGCGTSKQTSTVMLYKGDTQAKTSEKYETTKVEKGVYKEEISTTGEIDYTNEFEVTVQEENAYLDKILVKKNQKVKKGDVLAYYHIETSKTSLKKKKLLLDQAKSAYDSQLKSKRSEVLEQEKLIKTLTDEAQSNLAKIELDRLKKEYDQIVTSGEGVRQQQKEYNALLKKQKRAVLKADVSGVIINPVKVRDYEGTELMGEPLMTIRDKDDFLIEVKPTEGVFRYNMKVEIGLGSSSDNITHTLKGKVMSTDNLTQGSGNFGYGQGESEKIQSIKISKSDMKKYDFDKYNIFVTGTILQINDALMVDAKAVHEEPVNEELIRYFVYVLENEKLHKRYIVSNYKNDECFLVSQGLEEGQTLAITEG